MEYLKIDHGLIELEIGVMNGGLQVELYDKHEFERMMISLSYDEIRRVRDLMNTVLESEDNECHT